jgi:dolichyl-diphosphooligosaccharide--protein glycosyltransferase
MADDDVSMLSWFKKKKSPEHHHSDPQQSTPSDASKDESLSLLKGGDNAINFQGAGKWAWEHRNTLLTTVLVLALIIISWTIRVQSSSVPLANDYATSNVLNFIHNDIDLAYQIQYPNLPQQNRANLVNQDYSKAVSQPTYTVRTGDFRGQSFSIAQQIANDAANFRSFFQYEANGRSFTYMPDIDPYTWLRYARNYVEHGDIGDERRNGEPYDNHMVAPIGAAIDTNLHPYLVAWLYEFVHIFSPNTPLMQAAGYLSLIVIALSVFPVFFIGRRVAGTAAGFFAALFFITNGALLGRTLWGHVDTDGYNVFFPLMTVWCFLESYYAKTNLKRYILVALGGIATGLFSYLWVGWWYIFDFLLAVGGIYFAYLLWIHRKDFKSIVKNKEVQSHVLSVLLYILVSGIIVTSIFGLTTFIGAPLQPVNFISIKNAAKITLFPNVLTTVAELNEASLGQVVQQMGGVTGLSFIFVAVIGLLLLSIPRTGTKKVSDIGLLIGGYVWYYILIGAVDRLSARTFMILFAIPVLVLLIRTAMRRDAHTHTASDFDVKLVLFLIIWFLATMYASTKGIRFVMLLVPAFSIAFGAGIGLLSRSLGSWGKRLINVNPKIITGVIIALFALIMLTPTQNAYSGARSDLPIVNDGWYNTLTKIKDNSLPTAIITSWWDFGHHFKYYADRPVTFDGASQNEPMAHWVGKILLLDDEKQAVGILRMLHCGSTKAFDTLNGEIDDASLTVDLLNGIFKFDKAAARQYLLKHNVSAATADKTLEYTHCTPPEAFFIASGDMIGKSGVWAHFGSWDFNRADMWVFGKPATRDEAIQFMKKDNVSEDVAGPWYDEVQGITNEQDANAWIAPWPSYSADLISCNRDANTLTCGNGITVDLATMDVTLTGQQDIHPSVFAYPTKDNVVQKTYNSTNPYSITLVPQGDSYTVLLAHKALAASMFTRMYYLRGQGLRYFKPFNLQRDANGGLIYTYKVDWTGNNATEVPETQVKLQAPPVLSNLTNGTNETP